VDEREDKSEKSKERRRAAHAKLELEGERPAAMTGYDRADSPRFSWRVCIRLYRSISMQ
jgi:hypothetical protein